jgi:hypothetical protein
MNGNVITDSAIIITHVLSCSKECVVCSGFSDNG